MRQNRKGAPGHVKIKPMLDEVNEERVNKIDDTIDKMIKNPDDIRGKEIRKELLGL